MLTFMLIMGYVPVGIQGNIPGLENAYLDYMYGSVCDSIAVSSHPDSGVSRESNYAEFPALFNGAKAWCEFNETTGILTVTSEYPGSAIRAVCEYTLTADGYLELQEYRVHDPYAQALESMEQAALSGNYQAVATPVWGMMYPGNCTLKKEMMVVVLYAFVNQAEETRSTQVIEALHRSAEDIAEYLFMDDFHSMFLEPDDYSEFVFISLSDYLILLKRYEDLLILIDDLERSSSVETVLKGLLN